MMARTKTKTLNPALIFRRAPDVGLTPKLQPLEINQRKAQLAGGGPRAQLGAQEIILDVYQTADPTQESARLKKREETRKEAPEEGGKKGRYSHVWLERGQR